MRFTEKMSVRLGATVDARLVGGLLGVVHRECRWKLDAIVAWLQEHVAERHVPSAATLSRVLNGGVERTAPIVGLAELFHEAVVDDNYPIRIEVLLHALHSAKLDTRRADLQALIVCAEDLARSELATPSPGRRLEAVLHYLKGQCGLLRVMHGFQERRFDAQHYRVQADRELRAALSGFSPENALWDELETVDKYYLALAGQAALTNVYEMREAKLVDVPDIGELLHFLAGRYYLRASKWLAWCSRRADIAYNLAESAALIGRHDDATDALKLALDYAPNLLDPSDPPGWLEEPVAKVEHLAVAVVRVKKWSKKLCAA